MAAGVLERGFSHLQSETRGAVAGLLDGLLRLLDYLLRGLLQQAALTESRAAFNQPAGPGPAPQPGQVIVQRSHLADPAAQRVQHGRVRFTNLPGSHDGHAAGSAIPRHGQRPNGTIAPFRHGHTGDGTGRSRPGASARRLRGADPAAGGTISHRAGHLADRPRRRYGGQVKVHRGQLRPAGDAELREDVVKMAGHGAM